MVLIMVVGYAEAFASWKHESVPQGEIVFAGRYK